MINETHIDGVQIFLSGSGTPLVFLHSAGQSPKGYKPHIEQLSLSSSVIVPNIFDLATLSNRSIEKIASRLHTILEKITSEKKVFVGCSLGGGVALTYAALYPMSTVQVIVCDSIGYPSNRSLFNWMSVFKKMGNVANVISKKHIDRDYGLKNVAHEFIMNPFGVYNATMIGMRCDITNLLPTITVPVHFLWAKGDEFIPVTHGKLMQSMIPNASFSMIEDSSHYWYNREPLLLSSYVESFIKKGAPGNLKRL